MANSGRLCGANAVIEIVNPKHPHDVSFSCAEHKDKMVGDGESFHPYEGNVTCCYLDQLCFMCHQPESKHHPTEQWCPGVEVPWTFIKFTSISDEASPNCATHNSPVCEMCNWPQARGGASTGEQPPISRDRDDTPQLTECPTCRAPYSYIPGIFRPVRSCTCSATRPVSGTEENSKSLKDATTLLQQIRKIAVLKERVHHSFVEIRNLIDDFVTKQHPTT